MFQGIFSESIIKRAIENKKVQITLHNFREYATDVHHKVDDTPYGGGAGMVLCCQPIFDCVEALRTENSKVILLTPSGQLFQQRIAVDLSKESHLILICGHYEGFDERILTLCDLCISIGDYVLTGGEVASMVLVEAIVRLLPGVIREESFVNDSFYQGLLDYPTYTKPREFRGLKVPEVLLSGNHQEIAAFRRQKALEKTVLLRPDLGGNQSD